MLIDRFGGSGQARFFESFDVDQPVEYAATEFQKLGANPFAAPPLECGLTDVPADGQLFLVEMNNIHFGIHPNELVGVHERSVPSTSQAIGALIYSPQFLRRLMPLSSACEKRYRSGIFCCQTGAQE